MAVLTFDTASWRVKLSSKDNYNPAVYGYYNNAWSPDTLYHVIMLYDPYYDEFTVSLNGTPVGTIALAQSADNQGVRVFKVNTGQTTTTATIAVDNFVSSTFYQGGSDPTTYPDGITIEDAVLELTFETAADDFDLFSVRNKSTDVIYAGWRGHSDSVLFDIFFATQSNSIRTDITNHSPCVSKTYNLSTNGTVQTLELFFTGMTVNGQANAADVTATIVADSTAEGITWSIARGLAQHHRGPG